MEEAGKKMKTIKKNQVKIPEWILARYKRITVEWAQQQLDIEKEK